MMEWGEDGAPPPRAVEAPSVHTWFFNNDTVDKVLQTLMDRGQKVAGGDRLGKTIIFARNHKHAMFIMERFDMHYPQLKGSFARVIDNEETYADSLLDDFSMVNDHIDLIRQIQEDEYWTDVTVPMLELVRLRLRDLVKFIEKRKRTIVYADFKDTLGQVAEVDSLWLGTEYNIEQYRKRMRHFLRAHENHLTVNKLKRNVPITASELQDLERLCLNLVN